MSPTESELGCVTALCCECDELRRFRAGYKSQRRGEISAQQSSGARCTVELKCSACGRQTKHAYLRDFDPHRDHAEEKLCDEQNKIKIAQLAASHRILDQLGVRVEYRSAMRHKAELDRRTGDRLTVWVITIADDLDLDDHLEVLGRGWKYMLPANDERAATDVG